jgi:glycogen phosphorylase
MALDLTWSWEPKIQTFFQTLDPQLWEESSHNPVVLLARLGPEGISRAMERPEVQAAWEEAQNRLREHRERRPPSLEAGAPLRVAYFSLEFGLTEALPIYSGGLGVLAGDHLKAANDLDLPLVGVGLLYRQGFGRQRIDDEGNQYEVYPENRFEELPLERVAGPTGPLEVEIPLGETTVRAGVWRARVGRVPLYLLDTDIESNPPELRGITDRLYVPEPQRRLPQEMVLGIGGMRALQAMGIEATVFHMNEGHGFLVAVERIRQLRQQRQLTLEEARLVARAGVIFTTHTPVAAGSDYFDGGLVYDLLNPYLSEVGIGVERFMDLGRERPGDPREPLCTTYVGLRMADHAVGVSRLHGAVSRRLWKDAWPGLPEGQVPIHSVTNGVHMPSWIAPEIAALLCRHVDPYWWELDGEDPRWAGVDQISDADLWTNHQGLRRRLVEVARARGIGGHELEHDALTIGFSRRFATYKRANLLLTDPGRLQALLNRRERPLQFVFAGKSHPADEKGKTILRDIVHLARQQPRVAFLVDYDIESARLLVHGADVWLNNPRRFLEASGTSGMKAGANGALNLSVLDGWWDEGYTPAAGWAIPSGATMDSPSTDDAAEAEALYRLLEREVVPAFYERDRQGIPSRWTAMMRSSLRHVATQFSARRMVLDYFKDCYAPAARRVEQLRLLPDWGG